MQHVLVCAQDSVLAKKVRFLLANDRCDVEILEEPVRLDTRLGDRDVDLLVLTRDLAGEDAIELLGRIDPGLNIPPTLVLGGGDAVTADFIHLIPDPVDTQAIYRIASELLDTVSMDDTSDEARTLMALPRPDFTRDQAQEAEDTAAMRFAGADGDGEELSFTDVTGLDEIAGRLDQLESDQLNEQLSDAFDIDEVSDVAHPPRRPVAPPSPNPVASGSLEPARFAKALFQCWSKRVSGALVVVRPDETSTIYLEKGSPVHIESSIPGDQLGKALVARGRITDAQYADGAKRAIERGVHLGQALVDLGFFSDTEFGQELGQTARDRIVTCFSARSGSFELDTRRSPPTSDRPYHLNMAHIIADGIRKHADAPVLNQVLGEVDARYFKLNRSISELADTYPMDGRERQFLAFEGRAYNVQDATENATLTSQEAYKLLAILTICEETRDFTPGVKEFEDRIKEEQRRIKDLQSSLPGPALSSAPAALPVPPPASTLPTASRSGPGLPPISKPATGAFGDPLSSSNGLPPAPPPWGVEGPIESAPPPPPPPPPPASTQPPPVPAAVPPPPAPTEDIPPMPVPADGEMGMTPRPLVYAKPLPRGTDGQPLETSERTLSREHFQRGVTLLGQGNFANAEEAFRDAVALCSEEHVYLIGLARAIYYNPGYSAMGKVPVLRGIVERAQGLAPDDKRVATLRAWVDNAQRSLAF
ncbi:MAG: DUF4388 domain-containing protein [Deltaproteobacteria bacterium]|nr:DUF4388 domain-containing protein [Deltaproteobacteria bacterium]